MGGLIDESGDDVVAVFKGGRRASLYLLVYSRLSFNL